jgi:uncharacterized protein (TIGR00251 family)
MSEGSCRKTGTGTRLRENASPLSQSPFFSDQSKCCGDSIDFVEKDGRIIFEVKVVPGSSKTVIAGLYNGMLKVRLAAVPEKGKANQALVELLAEQFNIPKNSVNILSGLTSKVKNISVPAMPEIKKILKIKN